MPIKPEGHCLLVLGDSLRGNIIYWNPAIDVQYVVKAELRMPALIQAADCVGRKAIASAEQPACAWAFCFDEIDYVVVASYDKTGDEKLFIRLIKRDVPFIRRAMHEAYPPKDWRA